MSHAIPSRAAVLAAAALVTGAAAARATDINGVQPASLDQPRVNAYVSRTPGGTPLSADFGGVQTFNIQAFYDTGASGILLSTNTADFLGISRQQVNGSPAVYSDVGVVGTDDFNISEPLYVGLARFTDFAAVDVPSQIASTYTQVIGPVRTQIGPVGGVDNPLLEDLDVFGVPAMAGKVIVFDPKPVNTFADTIRTYVYDPGTPFNPADAGDNPGIPQTNRHVKLSYGSFDRFSTTSLGAAPPTLAANPFIGPNPVLALDPGAPADNTPAVTVTNGPKSSSGSWLLDTGAAASIMSKAQAAALGVTYDPATVGGDDPVLLGVSADRQFQLTIGGIGGTSKVAGFFVPELTIPTLEGDPITFLDAPVLVSDITVADPVTGQMLTLDGVFGMNFLVASAFVTEGGPLGIDISDLTEGAFDWVTFDQPNGVLGLQLPGAVPEPGSLTLVAFAGLALLRRRERRRCLRRRWTTSLSRVATRLRSGFGTRFVRPTPDLGRVATRLSASPCRGRLGVQTAPPTTGTRRPCARRAATTPPGNWCCSANYSTWQCGGAIA